MIFFLFFINFQEESHEKHEISRIYEELGYYSMSLVIYLFVRSLRGQNFRTTTNFFEQYLFGLCITFLEESNGKYEISKKIGGTRLLECVS